MPCSFSTYLRTRYVHWLATAGNLYHWVSYVSFCAVFSFVFLAVMVSSPACRCDVGATQMKRKLSEANKDVGMPTFDDEATSPSL